MAVLNILHFPDPKLRRVAEPVEVVDDAMRELIDNMFETMYDAPGIGLAAPQVGVNKRLMVIDVSEESDQPLAFINPEVITAEGKKSYDEGCLSVPGFYEKVTRPDVIRVRALDRNGEQFEMDADDLLAVCVQHEIDHLDGKLFVDYISNLKRQRIKRTLEKEEKARLKQTASA